MNQPRDSLNQVLRSAILATGVPLEEFSELAGISSQHLRLFLTGYQLESDVVGNIIAAVDKLVFTSGKIVAAFKSQIVNGIHDLGGASASAALRSKVLGILITRHAADQETPLGVRELQQQLAREGNSVKCSELRATLEGLIESPPVIAKVCRTRFGLYKIL